MLMHDSKVIGVGLPCTGNRELGKALELLGLRVSRNLDELRDYNAAVGINCPIEEIEDKYPNAQYILTIRDIEIWYEACSKLKKRSLGGFWQHPEYEWQNIYSARISEARAKCDKLLVLDLSSDEWEPLCFYLDLDVPDIAFPKLVDHCHTTDQAVSPQA